jgi:hypothetical protein
VAFLALLAGAGGILHLRADKRAVVHETAGRLAAARVLAAETQVSGGMAGAEAEVRLIELVNHSGDAVATAWVRRPRPLPAAYHVVMVYAGARTGRTILDLVPHRPDLVLVAPQYPYQSPRTLAERLRWPAALRRAAYRTVAGGLLTVSFLEREGLDPRRLLLVGSSVGSAFAVMHAALDPRVPRVLVVHGGGDFPLILRALERRRGHYLRGELEAWLAPVLLYTFEPLRYVGDIAPRELIVIAAENDRFFPTASTLALYERAGHPKRLLWRGAEHVRSGKSAAVDEVVREIEVLLGE